MGILARLANVLTAHQEHDVALYKSSCITKPMNSVMTTLGGRQCWIQNTIVSTVSINTRTVFNGVIGMKLPMR